MTAKLTQSEIEQLSAYLDGEVDDAEARRVESLLATDAAWQQAADELESLDDALDAFTAPPASAGLSGRIIEAAAREHAHAGLVIRLAKYLVPVAAAAAAAIIFISVYKGTQPVTPLPPVAEKPVSADAKEVAVENLVVEHLDFFKDYQSMETVSGGDKVVDDATLQALDNIESSHGT